MTAPLDLDAMRKRAFGGGIPGVTGGVPGVSIGIPAAPGAPATPGAPLPLGNPSIPFSQPDATTQPMRAPSAPTNPTTNGVPQTSTTDPMAFANTTNPRNPNPTPTGGPTLPRIASTPYTPPPAAVPAESTAALRNVTFANGVTGAAGSSAGGAANGTKLMDPTTGIYTIAGQPGYFLNGQPIDAVYNGGGLTINGQNVPFHPQSVGNATAGLSEGFDEAGRPTSSWGDVGAADSRVNTAVRTQTDAAIPGGSADYLNTFADVLNPEQLGSGKSIGDLGVTEQQLIDAGLGFMLQDPNWRNKLAGEETPFNLDVGTPGAGARQDGYYEGGASTGIYHPGGEGSPLGLVNGQYIDQYGRVVDDIENAANGIDPVTRERLAPLYDQPASNTSGKNPNGAYLTDGTAPSAPPLATGGAGGGRPTGTTTAPLPIPTTPAIPGTPAVPPVPTTGVGGTGTTPLPATGSGATPALPLALPSGAPAAANPAATSTVPLNPDDSLLGKVITPENTIDRFGLAQAKFDTFAKSTDPAYQATLRDTNRYNFGAGRGVSGAARNSIGDVATQRMTALDTQRSNFLTDALTGSIDDMYRNIGVEQQQQGFQKDLSDTAFNQSVTGAKLQDDLTNSDFGRWLASAGFARDSQAQDFGQAVTKAQLEDYLTSSEFARSLARQQAGEANNPSDIDLILSQIFGNQSSAAMRAAADSFSNAGKNAGSKDSSGVSYTAEQLDQILAYINAGKTGKAPTTTGSEFPDD